MCGVIAVERFVATVGGAVKFLTVRRCGLIWLLAVSTLVGCSESREGTRVDELCPSNMEELVALSATELERVDVGRMNLICADAVSVFGGSELPRLLRRLDEWAEDARRAEMRYRQTYEREPMRYDNSYAKYRAVNLALTIKEDFRCRYQKEHIRSGAMTDFTSPRFFRNPDDVFVSGLLRHRLGTCSSFPVLLVALGRRLGYPLYLKLTGGHMFCCWDDGKERFNLETNGDAVDTPSDEHYLKEPCYRMAARSQRELAGERLMVNLTNAEALSVFLETAGYCAEANGNLPRALFFYRAALKYRPESAILSRRAGRHLSSGGNR